MLNINFNHRDHKIIILKNIELPSQFQNLLGPSIH